MLTDIRSVMNVGRTFRPRFVGGLLPRQGGRRFNKTSSEAPPLLVRRSTASDRVETVEDTMVPITEGSSGRASRDSGEYCQQSEMLLDKFAID